VKFLYKRSHCFDNEREGSGAISALHYLPVKKTFIYYCCFEIPIPIIITISIVAAAPHRYLSRKPRSHSRLMVYLFTNDHDIIICIFSRLLDGFEKNDQLFAAQCIWWLAHLIQWTEVLTYYRHYRIFPSEYKEPIEGEPLEGSKTSDNTDVSDLDLNQTLIDGSLMRYWNIHPSRVDKINQDNTSDSKNRLDSVLKDTGRFLQKSKYKKQLLDPLRRTHQSKEASRKLSKMKHKTIYRYAKQSPEEIRKIISQVTKT
jgi:hypothetical protein